MKKTAAALVLLALISALCLSTAAAAARDADRWQTQLRQADCLIRTRQWDAAQAALEESYQDWRSRQPFFRIVAAHSVLAEADCLYRRVIAFASVEEQGELVADLSALLRQLELLALREQLSVTNIL